MDSTTRLIQMLKNQQVILLALRKLLPNDSYPVEIKYTASMEPFEKDPYMTGLIDGCIEKTDNLMPWTEGTRE